MSFAVFMMLLVEMDVDQAHLEQFLYVTKDKELHMK